MDQQAVTEALSEAIVQVARNEFVRLSRGLEHDQKSECVEDALRQLRDLGRGIMPNYDNRWVALFYLTWYQPRQINIAYRIVKRYLQESSLDRSNELFIIDFGCGALAMQFGVSLAFADIAQLGKSTPKIKILSIDSSGDMIRIGRRAWRRFIDETDADDRLSYLSEVCDSITDATMTMRPGVNSIQLPHTWLNAPPRAYRWISAIHTAYEENLDQVRNLLKSLTDSFDPGAGFITSQNHPENVRRSKEISPFNAEPEAVRSGLTGTLPQITQWRSNLLTEPGSMEIARPDYLTRAVRWDARDTNFMIFRKTEEDDLPW